MNTRTDMVTLFVARPSPGGRGAEASHDFLQLHRVASDYLGDTWQIVRGGIEPRESAVDAVLRELREETGLVPLELYRLAAVESFYLSADDTLWHSAAFCALVPANAEVVLNDEHDAFRWTPRDRMLANMMWASERALFDDLGFDILDDGPAKPHLRVPSAIPQKED